jgi:hypothetical protein
MIEAARELLEARFDPDEWNYHYVDHTLVDVEPATYHFLEVLSKATPECVPQEYFLWGSIAASFHDCVLRWTQCRVKCPLPNESWVWGEKRVRTSGYKPGGNEWDSAQEALAWMGDRFGEEAKRVVHRAIGRTAAKHDDCTVYQEYDANDPLDDHPVVIAVKMSDLGAAGTDPVRFLRGGMELALEADIDMAYHFTFALIHGRSYFDRLPRVDVYREDKVVKTVTTLEAYRQRLLYWFGTQGRFARGREGYLEYDMGRLPEPGRRAIRQLFCRFEESAKAAEKFARDLAGLKDPWEVARFAGYQIPPKGT